jgi:tRNA 5-methylaminomethyl-2-thiouridine biosynthesis bifunctional protein
MAEDIVWRNERTPASARFGDVYFSAEDGVAESRHVFLDGVGAPALWQGRPLTTIGETGFGTGLNFLLTWKLWRATTPPSARLHYVSVEGFPLSVEALARALAVFPEVAEEARALVAAWPILHPGHHPLVLDDGRVTLHLLLGPVAPMLAGLSAQVDAWYLDGFAPSRNPDMWTPEVFHHIARLSAPGAPLATFTAAGQVRRDLTAAGFAVEKRPGFGHKRESLAGRLAPDARTPAADPTPWFRRATPIPDGPVAILGGGIAGAAMANALTRAGRTAVLLEAGPALAREGSGNPSALMKPRLTPDAQPFGRFHALAWLHALRLYETLPANVWREGRGVLVAARDDTEADAQARLVDALAWPTDALRHVGAADAEALSGVRAPRGGLWYGLAGCLHPAALCPALVGDVEVRLNSPVGGLFRSQAGSWHVTARDGSLLIEAAAVVLCAGAALPDIWPEAQWPLGKSRGQISFLPAVEDGPRAALSFGGYLTPAFADEDGSMVHALGATYDRWRHRTDDFRPLRDADHDRNRALLRDHLPALAARMDRAPVGGRAGLRCSILDHMPLAGPVHDRPRFLETYEDLHHGRSATAFPAAPHHDGLFVVGGLGSRGFQTAALAAARVAADITGAPLPMDQGVAESLNPARFDVRALKRPPQARSARTNPPQ